MGLETQQDMRAGVEMQARDGGTFGQKRATWFTVECYKPDGELRWRDYTHNLVCTEGLNDAISAQFRQVGTAYYHIGLASGTGPSFAAGDTMSSHAGWSEGTIYSQAGRGTLTLAVPSGGSADNSLNKGTFSINASGTLGGAFLSTSNTKGGSTGNLYGGATFSTARTVASGDTLTVQINISTTAS